MGEETFYLLEWNIDNFSHWDSEIHEKVITSQPLRTQPQVTIELYPRGLSGKEEHVEVRLCSSALVKFTGVVSIIGSDDSILCTLEVKSESKLEVLHLSPGPKFEEVATEIRKNNTLYNDRLTLKYRFRFEINVLDYMCTTIDVMDISLKVSSEVFQNSNVSTAVSMLCYPLNEGEVGCVLLGIENDKLNQSKMLLTLRPDHFVKNFSILTRMTVLNNVDEVRTEENKHTFRNGASWIFSNSLSIEELEVLGYSAILDFKITPSIRYRQSFRFTPFYTKCVITIPLLRFKHSGRSVCKGASNKSSTLLASNHTDNSATMLATNLMCLYQEQDFSDFQLKCGDVSFPVHKAILSARSPVFKTMLSTDMKEVASGCMDIEDLDVSTLTRFLAFLYTGKVEDMQCDNALKLYYAADKYQVETLKKDGANFLSANVSVSNVCDVLSLADKHRDDELLAVVHDFFLKNFNQVLGSEEWKSFMTREPLLAVKTVTHIGEKI